MEAFWPGPLTLLLPRTAAVPDAVTAGRALVGVRMPAHPVALELIRRAGVPVAAPSANIFGRISPTTAAHVLEDLDGRIDAVLDAGPTAHGVESTVLDASQTPMVIYRPGAVTAEQIRSDWRGGGGFRAAAGSWKRRQGKRCRRLGWDCGTMRRRARLVLVEGPLAGLAARLAEAVRSWPGERVGMMLPAEILWTSPEPIVRVWGRWSEPDELARELYAGLRALDAEGCGVIVCPLPPAEGIGAAIRDRLLKAGTRD